MTSISICFIGNSHAGAWKNAWSSGGASLHGKYHATFFASRGRTMRDLRFEGSEIVAGSDEVKRYFELTSGGKSRIACTDYDAFVLIGLDTFQSWLLRQGKAGTHAHSALVPIEQLVSEDCFHEMALWRLRRTTEAFKPLRKISRAPIVFVARPFPGEAVLETEEFARFRDGGGLEYVASLVEAYRKAFDAAAAEMEAEVLWQPESTMRVPGFTKPEFVSGASQFIAGGVRDDKNDTHMNDAFGAAMIAELLPRLSRIGGPSPAA